MLLKILIAYIKYIVLNAHAFWLNAISRYYLWLLKREQKWIKELR